MISGCDGGVYETYDQGQNWDFKNNIPIAEVYKVTTDNQTPFYKVYIGTQDNNSLYGPSRTINSGGITNQDWVFTIAGDGFQTQVDWKDPNTIYAESQDGGLEKVDLLNGHKILIKGNYDQQFTNEELSKYFEEVVEDMTIELDGISFYLNHFPPLIRLKIVCEHTYLF